MRAQTKLPSTIAILVIFIVVTFIILWLVYMNYTGALPHLENIIAGKEAFKP